MNEMYSYCTRLKAEPVLSGAAPGTIGGQVQTTPDKREGQRSKRSRSPESSPESYTLIKAPTQAPAASKAITAPWVTLMRCWLARLADLHPSCRAIPDAAVLPLALGIMRVYLQSAGVKNARAFKPCVAAAFWISIKFVAARHTMPNGAFLAHVTGVSAVAVASAELAMLKALKWDVYSVAREAGLLSIECEDDEAC